MGLQKIILKFLLFLTFTTSLYSEVAEVAGTNSSDPLVKMENRSAFLSGEGKEQWVNAMKTKLPISKQAVGPFGKPQDVSVKAVKKAPKGKVIAVKSDAFLKAVDSIKISVIHVAEEEFCIGARPFKVGDVFPIVKSGVKFKTKVISIKSASVVFKNMNTGEQVRKNLNALPPGISSGKSIKPIDGVSSSGSSSAPLELGE